MKNYIQNKILKKKNKRHFQLLEVMVAIFLIMVCAVPSFKILTQVYQEQAAVVRVNQRDHLVHLIHAKVVEQLYKRAIPLSEIMEGMHAKFTDSSLQPELDRLKYEASYDLSIIEPRSEKGKKNAKEYLGKMVIQMKDQLKPNRTLVEENQSKEGQYDYLFYLARTERNGRREMRDQTPPVNTEEDKKK
ncbi:MAG: hypothetical protein H0V82_05680 [Candidatus Protochlamydia sp.]|nr:hypothetical protein [Candidatus Protochlamydia sp.]